MSAPLRFVDTAFFVGLADPRDSFREQIIQLAEEFQRERADLVTTDAVLIELANYFSRSTSRIQVMELIADVRGGARWEVIHADPDLIARAEERYRRFADKNWSLTDCISMEAMADRRIRQVATTDRGFEQAGFDVLMG